MTRIKICGVTRPEHALAAARAGADFFGLVFYPHTHRYLTPEQARDIVAAVREAGSPIAAVGIFVNTPAQEVNRLARFCPLDYVQLSGDEPWGYCREIERPVIKACRLGPGGTAQDIAREIRAGQEAAGREVTLLLDTQEAGKYGGTGRALDWGVAAELARSFPFLVAGGLTPENVAGLVAQAHPWGVDVSGGVETAGVKDVSKIQSFIAAVRRAEGRMDSSPPS